MADVESYSTELGSEQSTGWVTQADAFYESNRPEEVVFVGEMALGLVQAAYNNFSEEVDERLSHNYRLSGTVGDMLSGLHELMLEDLSQFSSGEG